MAISVGGSFVKNGHYCPVKNLGNSIGYRLVQLRNSRPRERMPSGSRFFQKPPPKRPAAMCREAPPARAVCARLQPAHRPKRSVLPVFMTNPSPRHRRGGASGSSNPPQQRSAENHSVSNAYQETRFNEPDTSDDRQELPRALV